MLPEIDAAVLAYTTSLLESCQDAGYDCINFITQLPLSTGDAGLRMFIQSRREDLLRKGVEPPEFPQKVAEFFFGSVPSSTTAQSK